MGKQAAAYAIATFFVHAEHALRFSKAASLSSQQLSPASGRQDAANLEELENLNGALEARGRWTREELGMPVPDRRSHSYERRWSSDLNQHDRGGSHRNRGRGVHANAQRASVGGIFVRVGMRHLYHGQQRQQYKTQDSHDRQST